MKRNKHSLSHYKLCTFDMGELIPVGHWEALPGDTAQQSTSALVRVSPLVSPVMHPVSVRIHHWFVPYRLLWSGWEDFITGGPDGLGGSAGAYPTISLAAPAVGSLADYLGVPPGAGTHVVSAFPFRAFALIFNEFYRDEDLVQKLGFSNASGPDSTTNTSIPKIAWEKDYFTASRPWTQKGPTVTLPLGQTAPVVSTGGNITWGGATLFGNTGANPTNPPVAFNTPPSPTNPLNWGAAGATTTGLQANLAGATAANVNDIRRAFALQRYQEARAMYGSRFTEYLRYLGIRSSDARLQRPEYCGGGKQVISFSEVLRTGSESDPAAPEVGPIGELKGHGIAAMRSRRFRRFFEEHGIVMSLMSVRPRTMYLNGLHRSWNRRTKEDYWQRELEQIGQQEVYQKEIYADGTAADNTIFGYNDRYSDYRHLPSQVSGDFRTTLDFWHLGRIFSAAPVLNASFINCDPSKRIHAIQTEDVLWNMISHSIQVRRLVRKAGVGRII